MILRYDLFYLEVMYLHQHYYVHQDSTRNFQPSEQPKLIFSKAKHFESKEKARKPLFTNFSMIITRIRLRIRAMTPCGCEIWQNIKKHFTVFSERKCTQKHVIRKQSLFLEVQVFVSDLWRGISLLSEEKCI